MSARPRADRRRNGTGRKKDKRNPDIDGNIVVWEDMRNAFQDAQGWWHNPDIYMKNLSTGVEQAGLHRYSATSTIRSVSGNRVFWQDYRNGNWDIYMKDLSTGAETRLTTNTSATRAGPAPPAISWSGRTSARATRTYTFGTWPPWPPSSG